MSEFVPWPKIARLNRDITVTEKIDGTNAAIIVDNELSQCFAQSRTRLITPEADNFGFAKWVADNNDALGALLGPGHHFGEWWGQGIQRKYDQKQKWFSLFNTHRWAGEDLSSVQALKVVPVLYQGLYDQDWIDDSVDDLRHYGSKAAPGFMDAEGVVIWHHAARQMFKVTLKDDEVPKALVA